MNESEFQGNLEVFTKWFEWLKRIDTIRQVNQSNGSTPRELLPDFGRFLAEQFATHATSGTPGETPPEDVYHRLIWFGSLAGDPIPEDQKANYQYILYKLIGSGGFGEVYRALDQKLNREVAIKILPISLETDPALIDRFSVEIKSAAQLEHPNIIRIYDFGATPEYHFAVMEFVDGPDLREAVISVRQFQLRITRNIFIQIAKAAGHIHRKGYVHCDLKPENILINNEGTTKIIDFGLMLPESGNPKAQGRSFWGTPTYMAPEMISGDSIDHRADIYSIGTIMYEMRTGKPPFEGAPNDILHHHLLTSPRSPAKLSSNISPEEDAIIMKCLEKKPEKRFQTAEELLARLRSLGLTEYVAEIKSIGPCPFGRNKNCDKNLTTQRKLFPLINATGLKSNAIFAEAADDAVRSIGYEPVRLGFNPESFDDFCRYCQLISSSRGVIANVSNLSIITAIQLGIAMGNEKRFLLLEGPESEKTYFHDIFPIKKFSNDWELTRQIRHFIRSHDEDIKKSSPCFFKWQFHCRNRPKKSAIQKLFIAVSPEDEEEKRFFLKAVFPALREMSYDTVFMEKNLSHLHSTQDIYNNFCMICRGANTTSKAVIDISNLDTHIAFTLGTVIGAKIDFIVIYKDGSDIPKALQQFNPLKLTYLTEVLDAISDHLL